METLTCPKCHGSMRVYERSGITVDQCTECRGIFLDRGELEKLVDAEAAFNAGQVAPPPAAAPAPAPPQQSYQQPTYQQPRRDYDDRRRYDDDRRYDDRRGSDDRHYQKKRRKSFFDDLFD